MKFEVSARISYEVLAPSTLILSLQAYKSDGQFVLEESFTSNRQVKIYDWLADTSQKQFKVIELPREENVEFAYHAIIENTCKIIPPELLEEVPISLMPHSVLPYLNPSRYCQSDKLYEFASDNFGKIDDGYAKVIAVRDWIHKNIEYSAGYTNSSTSAYDTLTEHRGVCRDFAHLGIALCRALTIPARYFTGYAYKLKPQDFHACFEVYLGNHWLVIDATKLVPINGLVKIATGMDAADSALASIFGDLKFLDLEVNAKSIDVGFEDLGSDDNQGYCYF